jgi:hypothetical protein|tara:strand:- start:1246 stop:1470 length:225 start_codon:yes stop_codon:yes gene_type:complete
MIAHTRENVTMKPYIARFKNIWGERYEMSCDGVSDTHANARAWLKFMKTSWYSDAPRDWELEVLRDADWKGENV